MSYSIFKYGSPMQTEIEDLEQANEEALCFVTLITGSEFVEIRESGNVAVTIGYFDGHRFHWTRDKIETEAWKSQAFVTGPPLWREGSQSEERRG